MGKRNYYKCNYGDARIIYKKSNTICTQSRTWSGASQFYTRSGVLQYQKHLSGTNGYYIDSGKIKRDLSVETDVCILRRYYKSKRNKLSTRDSSNKSKYSTVITEVDSVKEFRHGAYGDSRTTTKDTQQVDIAAIMVENLKGLLTNWIQKHLLENKDTQDKIETVLHSILHKGKETKANKISSRSTYILSREGHNYEVKNKKVETVSLICDYCKHKSRPITTNSSINIKDLSSQSVPNPVKKLRVLSTLSIPRNINLPKNKSLYKVKNNKFSGHKPKRFLESSSFDILAISTRSFTKRCATYGMKKPKKRRIAFNSKPVYKNISNTTETEEKEGSRTYKEVNEAELEDMPSLVKSIYADHPANCIRHNNINRTPTSDTFNLNDKNNLKPAQHLEEELINKDNKYTCKASFANTLNEKHPSDPMITIDFLSHSVPIENEFEENNKRQDDEANINSRKNVYLTRRRRSLKLSKLRHIQNRKITLCQKKDENKELLNHIQSILKYITDDGGKGNVKLDIHVSVLPVKGKSVDVSSHISNTAIENNAIDLPIVAGQSQDTEIISNDIPEQSLGIIPLLDCAVSQAKYIFNTENSIKSEPINEKASEPIKSHLTADQGTKTSKLEIVQEIHDLKSVVKNLLHTAETLVSEQLKKETHKHRMSPYKNNDIKTVETLKPCSKPISQGIQISNDFAKNLLLAGIKLSKEPKKDTTEFCHRLMRKSTSYKIIESESVLRVTDMTVGDKTENSPKTLVGILPKSKSLIHIPKEKKEVIAYYCDAGCNNDSCCGRENSLVFSKISLDRCTKSKKKQNSRSSSSCECSRNHTHQPVLNYSEECLPECPTSVYIDVEECCDKKSLIPPRKGMGFGEGFIYCLLLWIPVTIIACLFYNYVIKDFIHPSDHKVTARSENKNYMKQRIKMQSNHGNISKELKRSKSITRYPKIPTYVVAFAMHETYDDLMSAQQMICKRSPQGSNHSVTPTNSVKILDTSAIEKFTHITDMPEDNDQTTGTKDATQCLDIKEDSETTIVTVTNVNNSIKNIQPEVIFNSTHMKRFKDDSKFRKKRRKNKHVDKFKNLHFKCKHCKSINKKIELHYTKSKRTAVATDIVEKGLCNLSNIINQSRTLKKVLAVENLLEEQPLSDGISTDEFASLSSSTTKRGIPSHSSDNTLTQKWSSSSSRYDDFSSINTNSSVIQVSSENMFPYKTDVINVAVAVAFNKAKTNEQLLQRQFMTMNEEIYLAKHDLTGTETVILPPITLTSKSPSYENSNLKNVRDVVNLIKDSSSNTTLIDNNKKSSMAISIDEDTFVIARTSSDFNKSSFNSNLTLTNSETQSDDTINGNECLTKESDYHNKKLFDTVINLGMFPEANPSTSKFNENTVIITNEHKTYVKKNDDAIINEQGDLSKNILKKIFDVEKNLGVHKIITLPDEAVIKAKLKENNVTHRKTEINEFQNTQPSTLSDMWDRLIAMLDAALKRIEETLPDRIVLEIKKILDFDEYKNFVLKVMSEKTVTSIAVKENMLSKGVCVDLLKTETDENLQCDLVQNQVIDRLMTKLYPEGPTNTSTKFSHKLITKIFKEYFKDLSPGVVDLEKEDLTASGVELELAPDVDRFHRLKVLLTVPIKFVKQNAFVMTSVPTFLLILLCAYGLIIFIMKPL